MSQILKQISTNAFVNLGCNQFKKLLVTNTGTNTCNFNLAAGIHRSKLDDYFKTGDNTLEGDTSISSVDKGFYFLRSINIPAGVTLEVEAMQCDNIFIKQTTTNYITDGRRSQRVKTSDTSPTLTSKTKQAVAKRSLKFFASLDDASDSVNIIINK